MYQKNTISSARYLRTLGYTWKVNLAYVARWKILGLGKLVSNKMWNRVHNTYVMSVVSYSSIYIWKWKLSWREKHCKPSIGNYIIHARIYWRKETPNWTDLHLWMQMWMDEMNTYIFTYNKGKYYTFLSLYSTYFPVDGKYVKYDNKCSFTWFVNITVVPKNNN